MDDAATTTASRARARFADAPGVSWWHVIVRMEACGYTHSAIAAAVGVSRQSVESWKNRDIEPAHEIGERMVALWVVVTGMPREDIPRKIDVVLSAASFR